MKQTVHTLVYATVLGIVCAVLLTGADRFTKEGIQANKGAERDRNVLGVLGVEFDPDIGSKELVALSQERVREVEQGGLPRHELKDGGGVEAVAFPFAGQGLWGPVEGFLAMESDLRTIRGVSFYKQEETPGLGGEIGSAWFRDQFKEKSILDAEGNPGIRVLKPDGLQRAENEVDGITGATMTCEKVEGMLNRLIERIVTGGSEDVD
jgi:Na+-transporting NADH:ubiquinone oxidoreductase subunit C